MATENNQMADDVTTTINGEPNYPDDYAVDGEDVTLEPLPDRPADGAPKAKWVDYVVALGADRDYVSETLTRDELRDLADRLGG